MTLVLSVATPVYALHVSDRVVSKGGAPYDALANKCVVLRATDGLLAFGYTGAASLDELPTDTWIANILSNGSCKNHIGALAYGDFPVRDVGSSLRALHHRLRGKPQFTNFGGEINAVGWQWNRKRQRAPVRNVLWQLHRGSGTLRWQQTVPRHIPERKTTFRMVPTGDWALSTERWQLLLNQVASAEANWQLVENMLVDAIREASERKPGTIGSHCMSILLRPWKFPNALVRFIPHAPHTGTALGQQVEVAYSPWMVAPDAIHAPAVLVGGLTCEQGLLTYTIEAPQAPEEQNLKGAFQSQGRCNIPALK